MIKTFTAIAFLLILSTCQSSGSQTDAQMDKRLSGPITYAALGDSTGAGVGGKNGGYVTLLFNRIVQARPGSTLHNFSVSGARTEDVLRNQIAPALEAKPTLITIGIGTNDATRGMDVERFARNYEEILSRIRAQSDATIVVTNLPDVSHAPVIPLPLRGALRRQIELYNQRIAQAAEKHSATVVDAFNATHKTLESRPEFFSSDGFHPSDAGYEHWAEVMWPVVKNLIGE